MTKITKAYGLWASPISAHSLAESLTLTDVQWDTTSDTFVWHEQRGAKGVLVAQVGEQAPRDLTDDQSVRARVGYGGGDFTVAQGHVYFSGNGGRLYRQNLTAGSARPITPAFGDAAAPRVSADGKWLLYVHSYEDVDTLALVDTDGKKWPRKFAEGFDFVMQPAWHPDGEYVAYVAWNHPQMPWDGTELRLVTIEYDRDGIPFPASTITIVGDTETSIFQPEFSPDGRYLAYISDVTGWNQLYLYDIATQKHTQLTTAEADHGQPAWVQGMRVFGWSPDSQHIIYTYNLEGSRYLTQLDIRKPNKSSLLEGLGAYTDLSHVAVSPIDGRVAVIASSAKIPSRIVTYTPDIADVPPVIAMPNSDPLSMQVIVEDDQRQIVIHRRSSTENIPTSALASAEAISWTGHDGGTAYGLYYAPTSDKYEGIGAPPLIVYVHGGPTSQVMARYYGEVQQFATKGYAVLMVNHRGGTGYGREYMNKLRGNWGIYDVEDSASGAAYLASKGLADPKKFVILGGSAGGYTVLQSMVSKPGFYKAGVCLYGVSNQFGLAMDTHKFEAHYSDSLLGPLPQAADLYRERSPLFHADKIVDTMIVFQGEDDNVVPRNQSDAIVDSLKQRGITHEYHVYAGEGHGWRKPETIEHYHNAVIRFLTEHVVYA